MTENYGAREVSNGTVMDKTGLVDFWRFVGHNYHTIMYVLSFSLHVLSFSILTARKTSSYTVGMLAVKCVCISST